MHTENIDYTDRRLYEADPTLPIPDRDLTPEELEELIINDIKAIYAMKDAI